MVKVPCKECILLAMCKSEGTIKCNTLRDIFIGIDLDDADGIKEVWDEVHKTLPKLSWIEKDLRK